MRNHTWALLAFAAMVGVAANTSSYADSGNELLVSGPVEQIDHGLNTVTVLGQTFKTSTDQLSVGEIVNVYGKLASDGTITDPTVQGTYRFGTNGDAVFLKGVVTTSDGALGRVQVDGITIDYTPQFANTDFSMPTVGDVVAIAGTEPAVKGVLIAAGTGMAAYNASAGGGASSFAVAAGVAGSGSRTAGMTGSGIVSAGMTGSGIVSAGMTGSGIVSAGMTGSGIVSAGMTGSGIVSAGMTGSGIVSAGMTGSGIVSAGMTGSGIVSAGMTGSGVVSAGMTGSGIVSAGMTGSGRVAH